MQAFAKGLGPFFEHLLDPDFLHAVSCRKRKHTCAHTYTHAHAHTCRRLSSGYTLGCHALLVGWWVRHECMHELVSPQLLLCGWGCLTNKNSMDLWILGFMDQHAARWSFFIFSSF